MNEPMAFTELEQVYDLLAETIDKVGEKNESLFLSKLALTLAHELGDLEQVREAVRIAAKGLAEP